MSLSNFPKLRPLGNILINLLHNRWYITYIHLLAMIFILHIYYIHTIVLYWSAGGISGIYSVICQLSTTTNYRPPNIRKIFPSYLLRDLEYSLYETDVFTNGTCFNVFMNFVLNSAVVMMSSPWDKMNGARQSCPRHCTVTTAMQIARNPCSSTAILKQA